MKTLTYWGLGVAAALSLGSPTLSTANDFSGHGSGGAVSHGNSGRGGFVSHAGGFHAPALAAHGSGFHAPAASSHPSVRFFSRAPGSGTSARTPTFAFGGHPADPPATKSTQRSNSGNNRATNGWDRHWDRIWHGRHYHWNNGAWVIINDGFYPWDDSYYLAASPDEYPDTSDTYEDTAPDAGAPNPAPNAPVANAAPQPDSIAADVQQSLASRGYYNGEVDGIVGDVTREAIADFQKDNHLPITGYITKSLLNALGL